MKKSIKCYKFVTDELNSRNGNMKWKVGEWIKHEGALEICDSGLHACRTPMQSLQYVCGNRWFICEAKGKIKEKKGDKLVASEMRLLKEIPAKKVIVYYATACARRSLKNYEKHFPNDKRPHEAIRAAEDYIDGKIDISELKNKLSAAGSAAWSAGAAAWSAESAARAAGAAAESATWSAELAARAAESAEKKW